MKTIGRVIEAVVVGIIVGVTVAKEMVWPEKPKPDNWRAPWWY